MLIINNITKVFAKGTVNEKKAIDKLSLNVSKGEFITVIGSNGAGKSTLMNCIAGSLLADSGLIYLDGEDIGCLPEYKRAKKIGRVFQDPLLGTAFDMSIEENLSIAAYKNKKIGFQRGICKRDKDFFKERLELLDMGLENRLKQKTKLLSGGQRQALTLFMAILSEPRLLLLDEHTAALDPIAAGKVLKLTDFFTKEKNITTIMITHNMKSALEHGSRTILMKDGRIKMDIKGKEREETTVNGLISQFSIDNDRMLL